LADGWTGYKPLVQDCPNLKQILSEKGRNFPMLYNQIRNFKNWLRGLHTYCDAENMANYINAYFFRFNRRNHQKFILYTLIERMSGHKPMTFRQLKVAAILMGNPHLLILPNNIIMGTTSTGDRGHNAEKPTQIPKKGWKDIALRVKDRLKKDHVSIISAGIAYYFFLATFPAITAALSIYGLLMGPAEVAQQIGQLANVLPEQAHQLISNILEKQSEKSESSLGWSLVLSAVISLWIVNNGSKAVFQGVNIAYNEKDERGFFKLTAVTLLFTIAGIVIGFISIAMVVAFPALIDKIGLPSTLETIIQFLRWPILALIVMFALAALYKVAPHRKSPEFKWTSYGAIIATALWLGGSLLFGLYVNNFGRFDQTYGSFAAVIFLILWFFLTGFVILFGAEINAEMEHQTSRDTTTGEDKPMGQRGGYYADHVARKDKGNNERQ
jgi:membrane protein